MDVSSESPSLASERLRKAIERNRQKQQMRQGQRSNFSAPPRGGATMRGMPSAAPSSSFTSSATENNNEEQRSFDFSGEQAPPRFSSSQSTRRSQASASNAVATVPAVRKLVTRPEDIEFDPSTLRQRPAPKTRALVPAKKKARAAKGQSKFRDLLVKGAWIFCGILLIRLFFSGGGILDFYQGLQLLEAREYEYSRISAENAEIVQEIEQIQNDVSMQKKIVREHLGFIGSDEFLILFASESVALEK